MSMTPEEFSAYSRMAREYSEDHPERPYQFRPEFLPEEYDPRGDIHDELTRMKGFFTRLGGAARRFKKERAESGFTVYSNGTQLAFGPLVLGTRFAEDEYEVNVLGFSQNIAETGVRANNDIEVGVDVQEPGVVADFHMHPHAGGFSHEDIAGWENIVTSHHYLDLHPNLRGIIPMRGIVLPVTEHSPRSITMKLSAIRILSFGGKPTSTEYVRIGYEQMSINQQVSLLQRSGLDVRYVEYLLKSNGTIIQDSVRNVLEATS